MRMDAMMLSRAKSTIDSPVYAMLFKIQIFRGNKFSNISNRPYCLTVQPPQPGISMASYTLLQEDTQQPPLEQERIQLKKTMALMMLRQQIAGEFHPEPESHNHMVQVGILLQSKKELTTYT